TTCESVRIRSPANRDQGSADGCFLGKPRPTSRRNRCEVRIWPAGWLCEALGVSRGGFYAWLTRSRSQRSRSDEELGAKVRTSFIASDRTYGARRVWKDMLAQGLSCGLHRIERLMRLQALKARPRRRCLPPDLGEPSLRTCSTAPSTRLLPIANGLLTSRMCGQRRVGSMWLLLSIFSPARGRLVDEGCDDSAARYRCPGDGDLAPRQARCAATPLRPW